MQFARVSEILPLRGILLKIRHNKLNFWPFYTRSDQKSKTVIKSHKYEKNFPPVMEIWGEGGVSSLMNCTFWDEFHIPTVKKGQSLGFTTYSTAWVILRQVLSIVICGESNTTQRLQSVIRCQICYPT